MFIYGIQNKINGKIYIGSTVQKLCGRWGQHRSLLQNDQHPNPHLQGSWNKFGQENFDFIMIEETQKNLLFEREQYWINYYKSQDNQFGYNIKPALPPASSEALQKMHQARLGFKWSETERQKMKGKNAGLKNGQSKLTWEQVAEIRQLYSTGRYSQLELGKKFGLAGSNISLIVTNKAWILPVKNWIDHSDFSGDSAIQALRKERIPSTKLDWIKVRDIRAKSLAGNSIGSISKEYGLVRSTVYRVVNNKTWWPEPSSSSLSPETQDAIQA